MTCPMKICFFIIHFHYTFVFRIHHGGGNINDTKMEERIFPTSHNLIMMDETMLRSLLEEVVVKALESAKNESPKPYTRKEAMEVLHCKDTTLWNYQQRGMLNPYHLGKQVLYEREEIDNLLNGRCPARGGAL